MNENIAAGTERNAAIPVPTIKKFQIVLFFSNFKRKFLPKA